MGIFGRGKSGGLMNVIRCDEKDYLVWKWRPLGQETDSTTRENSIRFGSSLRVKDGEVAVFVYKQRNGVMQDFIYGPYDDIIKTANFPILASIVGMAYGGESPFQAEIYFINLSGVVQIPFGIPYFDVFDPRFPDFAVPIAVGGSITFHISDALKFIKTHRLINFSLPELKEQIKDAVIRRIKGEVMNTPEKHQMPVLQIERRIDDINDLIKPRLVDDLEDFGVTLKRLDISRIDIDKDSSGYYDLRSVTIDQQKSAILTQGEVNNKNIREMQEINARNLEETLAIQREESQRAQRLATESQFIGAHALNRQVEVMQTAAENMGGGTGFGSGTGSSGINPAQFMTGMAVGGALGNQMAGMVNNMGQAMNNQWQQTAQNAAPTPPPIPGAPSSTQYTVAINGQQYGPYPIDMMAQMAAAGQINADTLVWAPGMPQWAPLSSIAELAALFAPPAPAGGLTPPPIPT